MAIYGNTVGGFAPLKVMQLELEDGTVLEGVVAEEAPVIDATENDIRLGKKAITSMGVIEGQKVIPSYHTTEGTKYVAVGGKLIIQLSSLDRYNYTKLQVIICEYNTSLSNSVAATKVVINNNIYNVASTESISIVSKDDSSKSIILGITNDGNKPLVLRYFTYKEID